MILILMGLLSMTRNMKKMLKKKVKNKHKRRKRGCIHHNPVMQFHTSALFIKPCPFATLSQEIIANHCP